MRLETEPEISTRTTSPKRRRRSSDSTASSRSSASSDSSKSASRVTRKKDRSAISMPGQSAGRSRGGGERNKSPPVEQLSNGFPPPVLAAAVDGRDLAPCRGERRREVA